MLLLPSLLQLLLLPLLLLPPCAFACVPANPLSHPSPVGGVHHAKSLPDSHSLHLTISANQQRSWLSEAARGGGSVHGGWCPRADPRRWPRGYCD